MTAFVKEAFEKELIKYFPHTKDAIAVNSGTSALIACLWSLDMNPGDEVITTPFTFQATTNAIVIAGGTPVFVDIGDDYLINADLIEEKITDKTRAIVPVNIFGKLCNIKKISDLAYEYGNIAVIEDSAQSFGGQWPRGSDAQCYSFYKTKNLSTFEGGAIVIPNVSLLNHKKIRAICDNGQTSKYYHEYIGFNFKMSDMTALLGLERLKLHMVGALSELGMYGPQSGHYPTLTYQQPAIKKRGITGDCPNAERLVRMIK
jgi:dTDP-4-amino-4,6-dideoxygalactose transaminase